MEANADRRAEQRLRYHWPVWFAEDFDGVLTQGQMADISSTAAAFTCYTHEWEPYPGQEITARFGVPRNAPEEAFEVADFVRTGHVRRVDNVNRHLWRIALQFTEPLPLRPAEQHPASRPADRQRRRRRALV